MELVKRKWRLNATFRPEKSIIVCDLYSAGCTQSVVVVKRERERDEQVCFFSRIPLCYNNNRDSIHRASH